MLWMMNFGRLLRKQKNVYSNLLINKSISNLRYYPHCETVCWQRKYSNLLFKIVSLLFYKFIFEKRININLSRLEIITSVHSHNYLISKRLFNILGGN